MNEPAIDDVAINDLINSLAIFDTSKSNKANALSSEIVARLLGQIIPCETKGGLLHLIPQPALKKAGINMSNWDAAEKNGAVKLLEIDEANYYKIKHTERFIRKLEQMSGVAYVTARRKEVVFSNYSGLLVLDNGDGGKAGKIIGKADARKLLYRVEKTLVSSGDENYFVPVDAVKQVGLRETYWEEAAKKPPFMGKYQSKQTGEHFYQMPEKFADEIGNEFVNNFISELMQRAGISDEDKPVIVKPSCTTAYQVHMRAACS